MKRVKGPGSQALRLGRRSYPNAFYLITSITIQRKPIFADPAMAVAAIKGFTAARLLKDSKLFCWVLMPDHAHWLVQLGYQSSLTTLIGNMKSISTRLIHQAGYQGPIWQQGFHDKHLRNPSSSRVLPQVSQYIANNPKKAGLIKAGEIYPFWSGAIEGACPCRRCSAKAQSSQVRPAPTLQGLA